ANQFARCNDKLQLLYLEDVGHCPHDESPEQVNQAILNWIGNWS
ncbi:MAG: alpha/beta hydrolase, partial [Cuspidothrix sp.]